MGIKKKGEAEMNNKEEVEKMKMVVLSSLTTETVRPLTLRRDDEEDHKDVVEVGADDDGRAARLLRSRYW